MINEGAIRLGIFLGVFALLVLIELAIPRREEPQDRKRRWVTNLGMSVVNSAMLRFVMPVAAVGSALWAEEMGWGLFNVVPVDPVIAGIICFVALDFFIWLEHWASHKIPFLWHMHKVHHADPHFDVTTALRFHPLEIAVSMVWKALLVVLLGAPVVAVVVFEVVLNAAAMFNHANIKLPLRADRILRKIIVTPDMHRIHHSKIRGETDSNYGFNFPFWDYLFGTYTHEPKKGQLGLEIGLTQYGGPEPRRLGWSLWLPFAAYLRREKPEADPDKEAPASGNT
ncbi:MULTISPECIES: sterol desaturase family protein [Pseudovibrio]|uniref:sterol desaturase family protein n=1 Tax=Stappiaceae TaxID=2821832 RepID=UPI00236649F8|nr:MULTISPECIES: sterol desaturase family protein [Pseudovibrio]MDD7911158.1 sterol desaturase family protein [Pseudovibrio exalbescens]MDX5593154.1 sterol desaturase family protein [Pseudovibrio sp. SPO723]